MTSRPAFMVTTVPSRRIGGGATDTAVAGRPAVPDVRITVTARNTATAALGVLMIPLLPLKRERSRKSVIGPAGAAGNPALRWLAMPEPSPPPPQVTSLLHAWSQGDEAALQQLIPIVYEELRRVAKRQMASERPSHTLQTTALIHEVYVRLVDVPGTSIRNRAHFFAMCARLMRNVLVDFARSRQYQKRGGGAVHVALDEALHVTAMADPDLVAIDDALAR